MAVELLIRLFICSIFSMLLTGCFPLSGRDYDAFALKLIPIGTELFPAITLLDKKGYKCSTKVGFHITPEPKGLFLYCTRSRPGFMYGCLQSIVLDIDENTWRVSSNNPEAACTGL
jgi:hypothetical protein